MKDDQEKAEEILKKRRLAAKGIKERADGKPVDPLADMDSLDPDDKTMTAETPQEKAEDAADRGVLGGFAVGRSR